MFRLIRLTILLVITCGTAIFAARLVGRTRPVPLAILFTNPNGTPCPRPCLFGVQPGATSFSDAVAMVRAHPFTRALGRDEISDQGQSYVSFNGPSMNIDVSSGSDDRVGSINIHINIAALRLAPEPLLRDVSLGEFVALFGVPHGVEAQSGATISFYSGDSMIVISPNILLVGESRISAESPLGSIMLEVPDAFAQELTFTRAGLRPWRGFSNVRRYTLSANP
ncbi:MAG: hypothetical protein IT324_13015 [Anaerolineae bacterium]|nr:hypothetical protein [Anaerolineae bacterium]